MHSLKWITDSHNGDLILVGQQTVLTRIPAAAVAFSRKDKAENVNYIDQLKSHLLNHYASITA